MRTDGERRAVARDLRRVGGFEWLIRRWRREGLDRKECFAAYVASFVEPAPREACEMEWCSDWSGDELYPTQAYACTRCGNVTLEGLPRFCPNCGAKVAGHGAPQEPCDKEVRR